jgi:hypothetical protein
MPDSERRFILRESKVNDGKQKEFPILTTVGKSKLNEVRLTRDGYHTVKVCLQNEIAKKIWSKDFDESEGLELIVRDTSRGEDDEFELRVWPLVPYRLERIDRQVQLATFRVAVMPFPYYNRLWWDSFDHVESTQEQTGGASNSQVLPYVTEQSYFGEVTSQLFGYLHEDIPNTIKQAAMVGAHYFQRAETPLNWFRSLAALTGTHFWLSLPLEGIQLCLAGEDQDLETDLPDDKYLVEMSERIDKQWAIPALRYHYYRTAIGQSTYLWQPQLYIDPPNLIQEPQWYQPESIPDGGLYRPLDHYSTLVLPSLQVTDNTSGMGQAYANELATQWERCVKATERTLKGWFRATTRSDWMRYGGYHPVPLGSEVTQVLYRANETLVDFRGKNPPVWPKPPATSLPTVAFCKMTINQKIAASGSQPVRYVGTIGPPHSGPWSPSVAANALGSPSSGLLYAPTTVSSVIAEDSLGLFPWVDVGDTVLITYDGSRGVIINTTIAADL